MTTTLAVGSPMPSSVEIIIGGCPVWALPRSDKCASVARTTIRESLKRLVPERIDDCCLMVSELATNAYLHGLRGVEASGGPELAIYRRGATEVAELVVTVFDPDPHVEALPACPASIADLPPTAQELDELLHQMEATLERPSMKRGLCVVEALSNGRCGFYRTRSRRGRVSGKVAWFAIPAGPLAAQPPIISWNWGPTEAARELKRWLDARGLDHTYDSNSSAESVVSLRHLTVWCRDQKFQWRVGDTAIKKPYYDLVDVVEQIVRIHEDAEYMNLGPRP